MLITETGGERPKDSVEENAGKPPDVEVDVDQDTTNDEHSHSANSSTSSRKVPSTNRSPLHFKDGSRKIDLVLTYEDDIAKEQRRSDFLQNLQSEGLEIETEYPDPKGRTTTCFVKIHCPWNTLNKHVEFTEARDGCSGNLRVAISDYKNTKIMSESSSKRASLSAAQNFERFITKDQRALIASAQRSQIVLKIMTQTPFEENLKHNSAVHNTGIRRLLNDGLFQAVFPLHDGDYDEDSKDANGETNDRRLLYTGWASFLNLFKKQPLEKVHKYFGDKVCLYFAWLGFYTTMLIPASIVGILCFVLSIAIPCKDFDTPTSEICNDNIGGKTIMCPTCGKCDLWQLQDSCSHSKLSRMFDSPTAIFYAVFMALWAATFLKFWKRKQVTISWGLGLRNDSDEELNQPQESFTSVCSTAAGLIMVNSLFILLLFMATLIIVGLIVYRVVLMTLLYSPRDSSLIDTTNIADTMVEYFQDNAKLITNLTATIIHLLVAMILHYTVYKKLAIWLTNRENLRTQKEYEKSFTLKIFLLEFISYYFYLIYIAFFKGRFARHPGDDSSNICEKIRGDSCGAAGCQWELFTQIWVFMIWREVLSTYVPLIIRKISNCCRRAKYGDGADLNRWEQDYALQQADRFVLSKEYLDMAMQYGFVMIFAAAFPIAPLVALVINAVRIRLDARKFVIQTRRPLAERAADIGAWYRIVQGITYAAILINACIIAFTSDLIPRMVYKYTNEDGTLAGYTLASLSEYPTNIYGFMNQKMFKGVSVEKCFYRGYYETPRDDEPAPFQPTRKYYHIEASRLVFLVLFEHIVLALTAMITCGISDVPRKIRIQSQQEQQPAIETTNESTTVRSKRASEASTIDATYLSQNRHSIQMEKPLQVNPNATPPNVG